MVVCMNDFLHNKSLDWTHLDAQPYFIGMMSGTSLDALDAVLCRFDDEGPVVIESHSVNFPDDLKAALLALTMPNGVHDFIKENQLGFESELDVFGWASVFYGELAARWSLNYWQRQTLMARVSVPSAVMGKPCVTAHSGILAYSSLTQMS